MNYAGHVQVPDFKVVLKLLNCRFSLAHARPSGKCNGTKNIPLFHLGEG